MTEILNDNDKLINFIPGASKPARYMSEPGLHIAYNNIYINGPIDSMTTPEFAAMQRRIIRAMKNQITASILPYDLINFNLPRNPYTGPHITVSFNSASTKLSSTEQLIYAALVSHAAKNNVKIKWENRGAINSGWQQMVNKNKVR